MTSTNVIIGGLTASLLLIFLCVSFNSARYYEVLEFREDNILLNPNPSKNLRDRPTSLSLDEKIVKKDNIEENSIQIKEINLSKEHVVSDESNSSLAFSLSPKKVSKVLIVAEAIVGEKIMEEEKEPSKIEILQRKIFTLLQKRQITFKKNSGKIEKEGREVLDEIVVLISNKNDVFLEIQGHTDVGGKRKINQFISQMRANMVKKYLIKKGFSTKNIDALGFGESTLLFPDKPYNHLNRRVEIYIKRK
jgi:outer membrane protein OmpA-like peptidoglycan-associated protein